MLDDFVSEGPVVRLEKKPAELVGFVSEVTPSAAPRVSPTASWDWRHAASPPVLLSAGCVCAALTLGAAAIPVGTVTREPHEIVEVRQVRVFVAKTPVLISGARGKSNKARQPVAVVREPARKAVPRTRTPPPDARVAAFTGALRATTPPDIRQAVLQSVTASTPIATVDIVAPAAPPAGAAVTAAVPRRVPEEAAVRAILEMYRGAYEQLDAQAARRIWPSLDERRLARAFSDLSSQTLDFEDCRIDVGSARGVARCRGRATYVGRVGKRLPQTQDRTWTFQLQKAGDGWAIDSVRSE